MEVYLANLLNHKLTCLEDDEHV